MAGPTVARRQVIRSVTPNRSGFRLLEREDQTESRTFAHRTLDVDVAIMGIDHVFDDFGPESCSAGFSADGTRNEEAITDFWRHTTPCISHRNVKNLGSLRDLSENGDRAAGGHLWYVRGPSRDQ